MDFVPHTTSERDHMLGAVGLRDPQELFDSIPRSLRASGLGAIPPGRSEDEVLSAIGELAGHNRTCDDLVCFLGAGCYDHYVPSVVWALAGRAEFATSYTPYQPELSQGVLQATFEYQSLMCEITGLEASNASMYDGASAAAEAVTMAVEATGRMGVAVACNVSPRMGAVLRTYGRARGWRFVDVPTPDGVMTTQHAQDCLGESVAALVVSQPSFYGTIEDPGPLAEAAHRAGAWLVASFDPIAAGVLEPPGRLGADVVVGEGQALGSHMSFGGPAFGFLACRMEAVRRMPGRVVGETLDVNGRRAFVLTLQAREQHIRREKAGSNICSNQALNAIAGAIYLTWLGPRGLEEMARMCVLKAKYAADRLTEVKGVRLAHPRAGHFKEFLLRLPADTTKVTEGLAHRGFLGGLPVGEDGLLVAVTERRTRGQIDAFAHALGEVLGEVS
ncbi:MAG: aminomethyl-transferring glycine dehydrogenase subunit GcvPA [Actinomycetota bacterium]